MEGRSGPTESTSSYEKLSTGEAKKALDVIKTKRLRRTKLVQATVTLLFFLFEKLLDQ